MTSAIVLVDGEHYPPVTLDGIASVRARGYEVLAAVFCGGGEKLSGELRLGTLPIVRDPVATRALATAIDAYAPGVVWDLSDDPVVDHAERMRLVAVALARGVAYEAPGVRFDAPASPRVAAVPTIAVIGTGKRCGKTAIAGHIARALAAEGLRPVVVAMGRGGPAEPVVVRGDLRVPTPLDLLAVADAGAHAASDLYEDAVCAGVATVGARRAGAGPGGVPAASTVAEAVAVAGTLGPEIIVLEGSGTAVPPVAADATVLVARSGDDLREFPGAHRILLADLLVVTMAAEEVDSTRTSTPTSPDREQANGVARVTARFLPTPLGPVEGRTVYLATTAPVAAGQMLRDHVEHAHGATVAGITHHLADRARLERDLIAARGTYEVLACELKAAAVDVAVRHAVSEGIDVVFVDNRPSEVEGNLRSEIANLTALARERFAKVKRQ